MNAMINSGFKSVACGAAALLITAVLGMAFVQSTAAAPGSNGGPSARVAKLSSQPDHAWFGQPRPAVLVD
jgi:hypothetical protein